MNPATIHAAITKAHLHVPGRQGHNDRKFQPMAGISYRHNAIAGIAVPIKSGTIGRVQQRGFFAPSVLAMLNGGPDRGAARLAVALDGTANPVRTATLDRSLGSGIQPDQEQTIMNASPTLGTQPEIRPVFIARATLEKRVRRELAKQNRKLLKSRPGTPAYREYGQYAIENGLRRVVAINHDLLLLAHELGVLKPGERLKPKYDRISVMTYRNEEGDSDRIEHYVIGKPGAGKLLFDLLEGPFEELADAEEARNLIGGHSHE